MSRRRWLLTVCFAAAIAWTATVVAAQTDGQVLTVAGDVVPAQEAFAWTLPVGFPLPSVPARPLK